MEANPLNGGEEDYWQIGGSVMHKPSGLGIYATGNWENVSNDKCRIAGRSKILPEQSAGTASNVLCRSARLPDTDSWGVKPFWRKTWSPIGATVLYGEYAQYNDFYGLANINGVGSVALSELQHLRNWQLLTFARSLALRCERWGLGVVQEIDSAAMHVWLRWQHQTLDMRLRKKSIRVERG